MTKLIYPQLSYQLVGAMFSVYNKLGFGYHEKYYQRAFAKELQFLKLKYKKEGLVKIRYRGSIIGRYFVDFLVENKIIVEIKVAKEFYPKDMKQILAYLKAMNKKLGILFLFNKKGLKFKRVVN